MLIDCPLGIETRRFEFLLHPEPDKPMDRLNDGKVGPDGVFWGGGRFERGLYGPEAGYAARTARAAWMFRGEGGLHLRHGLGGNL